MRPDRETNVLDAKDRQIIGALFENARMPAAAIAKRARLGKEVVNYRIKRLMASGLLAGFNTVIDVRKIGWEMFFVYIRFRNIDIEREEKILSFLNGHRNVAQLFKCIGNYDAVLKVFARSYAEAAAIMKDIEAAYKDKIDEYSIDAITEESAVPFSFLYEHEKNKRLHYLEKAETEKEDLSKTDLLILRELSKNARMNLADMATKLKTSREILKYHVKKLERSKIILKYRPDVLPKVLGYNWYFLILKTGKMEDKLADVLESFLLNHPNVTYFYKTAGSSDVQVELRVKTNEKLNEILMQLRGILKSVLKRSELLTILDERKYTYMPECVG